MARDFKIELDNVEMINGSDDLLKDTKVTKVTLTGENKLNSLNSTFENCTELTAIEGDVNLDGVSDMTEMTLNTPLDELKVTNPTEENIQTDNSLNQVTNVKIGVTKYAKGGIQDVVGSLEWTAENFTYEDAILDNVYTNSSSIEESKNLTVSNTLEQKATSFEVTGQTYENLVNGKATKNLLDEMSMQQTEGKPTQFTPHMEQPICLEYIEGQTYQNLVEGKGEKTLISEYSSVINDFTPNTFKPPQNQPICLESMEGETYQNLIKGKGEYKLTDTFSTTWTESNNGIDNPPSMIEIPEIFGNTIQGYVNEISYQAFIDNFNGIKTTDGTTFKAIIMDDGTVNIQKSGGYYFVNMDFSEAPPITLKPNTQYSLCLYNALDNTPKISKYIIVEGSDVLIDYTSGDLSCAKFTTKSSGAINIFPCISGIYNIMVVEGDVELDTFAYDEVTLESIRSVGDLYVDESGEPILDKEGNEQYKLEVEVSNNVSQLSLPLSLSNGLGEYWQSMKSDGYNVEITNKNPRKTAECRLNNLKLKAGIQYNLSFDIDRVLVESYIHGIRIVVNGVYIFTSLDNPNEITSFDSSFILDKNADNILIEIYVKPNFHSGDIIKLKNIQLVYGDKKTDLQSNKTTILMPQPLRKVGNYSDKLYWDYDKSKFLIKGCTWEVKKFIPKSKFTLSDGYMKTNSWNGYDGEGDNLYPERQGILISNFGVGSSSLTKEGVWIENKTTHITLSIDRFNSIESDSIYLHYIYGIYTGEEYLIETKILEKPSLETYSAKTYITTNTEIQPSKMTVTNKEVKFSPLSLQPSKSYTVQLDSIGKDNKPITVNLGGATTTIQPTNDTSKHHRVSITTPSSLTTDNLDLSGEGVVVNDVMLFEGNTSVIKQDVDYMDGIQSIGELFESRNLFDYTQSEVGLLDHTNGKISEDNSWKYTTDFIPVEPNTTYCISQTSGSVFNYKIVEYNSSKTYLKGTNWTSSKGTDINRAYNTFTTSANTYYLRLGWQSSIFEIQLEEDTFPTEFMAFDTVRYKLEIQTYDSRWDSI